MFSLIAQHPTISLFAGFYLFTGLVAGMPDPSLKLPIGQYLAQWLYHSMHIWSNNLTKAVESKYPSVAPASTAAKESLQ